MKTKFYTYIRVLRVNQWLKNLIIFSAILFSGQLFNINLFVKSFWAFLIFCLLSSTSYVLNDIIDYRFDQKHPVKKNRPIASGLISIPEATFVVFILSMTSLILALFFSLPFFLLAFLFILLHFFYSLYLKRHPVVDIFAISFSFMLRTFAGEVATGFHIPIWLLLTIFFVSLFMATVKRHAELVAQGRETRASLKLYQEHLLNFMSTTFAAGTILAYASYTYNIVDVPQMGSVFNETVAPFEGRKWMMVTIPFVVYGIARYAQLLYEREQGERPEKIITTDRPLVATIIVWAMIVVALIYLF
ncbi:hypothetical protein A3F03_03120 [Candidatus Roizmanbacteria bacterium RIFCSPHIGHO2_12_FULL_41_11]|uniref:Phosphoribose diphosphate--decaprenyl-phosphate phosphoribosyltransferase n=2 Tax=Candidatus Roizmaniibacteriota TaxID=1752723 RepID=A0A1F7J8S8_9BACT|nr:MAG: hypothetical protein A3F03_03120 [Candidatus Roizmanbacteria bacterium RIFCSPHIGHO2_12_FULL_41_11]OGK52027.1 MAG: hypothetical protein A2966_02610 [Candidatus Roizmanbacteria bacterium RIFCSPLOWO2_01_FULL_41_22]